MEIKNFTIGNRTLVSQSSDFLGLYFNSLYQNRVSIPVVVATDTFILDIEKVIKSAVTNSKDMSEERMNNVMKLIVTSYSHMTSMELGSKLFEMGLRIPPQGGRKSEDSDELRVQEFVSDLTSRLIRNSVQSGLSNVLVSNYLTSEGEELASLSFDAVSMDAIHNVVKNVQSFYSKFIQRAKGDELARELNAYFAQNPILSSLRILYEMFMNADLPFVQCRESHFIDSIFESSGLGKLVEMEEVLTGRVYKVKKVEGNDLSFAEAIAGYIWSLNLSAGITQDTVKSEARKKVSEVLTEIVTGIGSIIPMVPVEAGDINQERLGNYYKKIYIIFLLHRMATSQKGDFYSRVQTTINSYKFFTLESHEATFEQGLTLLSMAYEAFRDTANHFRNLYKREDYMFSNSDDDYLHHLKRTKIVDFVEKMVANHQTFERSMDHPSYYKSGAHVAQFTLSDLSTEPLMPSWFIPRRELYSGPKYIIADVPEATLSVFSPRITSGSLFDIVDKLKDLPVSMPLLRDATAVEPSYHFSKPIDHFLATEKVIKSMISFVPLPDLEKLEKSDPAIADFVMRQGQIRFFDSVEHMSRALEIPLDIAKHVWSKRRFRDLTPIILDLSHLTDVSFVLEPGLVDVQHELRIDEPDKFVRPFRIGDPGFVIVTNQSFNMFGGNSEESSGGVDEPPKGKGKKGKKKKSEEEEPDIVVEKEEIENPDNEDEDIEKGEK
jgi:hypothetical protein